MKYKRTFWGLRSQLLGNRLNRLDPKYGLRRRLWRNGLHRRRQRQAINLLATDIRRLS